MMVSTGSQSAPAIDEADLEQRQTLWVGGLNEKVTEQILYELFMNVSSKHFSIILNGKLYERFSFRLRVTVK